MPATLLNLLAPLSAEIILALGAMALLMWGVVRDPGTLASPHGRRIGGPADAPGRPTVAKGVPGNGREGSRVITWAAIVLLQVTAVDIVIQHDLAEAAFSGAFLVDPFARFAKILVVLASAGALVLSLSDETGDQPIEESR